MIQDYAPPLGDTVAGMMADFGFGIGVAFFGILAMVSLGSSIGRSRVMITVVYLFLVIAGSSFAAHLGT